MDAGDGGPPVWAKRFSPQGTMVGGNAVAVRIDSQGNEVMTGYFSGTIDFGGMPLVAAGSSDIFVAKFDTFGNPIWSERFGGASIQEPTSLAIDAAGNIVITGTFHGELDFGGGTLQSAGMGDIFVVKFTSAGQFVWSKGFGDAKDQEAGGVAVDSGGNVVVTGVYQGTIDFGPAPLKNTGPTAGYDIYLAKLDSGTGEGTWSKGFGDPFGNTPGSPLVVIDSADSVILAGDYDIELNFGGANLMSNGDLNVYLAKFDTNANPLWSQTYGGAGVQKADDVGVDASGNIVLAGEITNGSINFGTDLMTPGVFLVSFDSSGSPGWSEDFAGVQTGSVGVHSSGTIGLTVSCQSDNANLGGANLGATASAICMGEYDAHGTQLWSTQFPGTELVNGLDMATGIAADPLSTAFVITGNAGGELDFGEGLLMIGSTSDVFLAKIAP
jgi:hypothetical protein